MASALTEISFSFKQHARDNELDDAIKQPRQVPVSIAITEAQIYVHTRDKMIELLYTD